MEPDPLVLKNGFLAKFWSGSTRRNLQMTSKITKNHKKSSTNHPIFIPKSSKIIKKSFPNHPQIIPKSAVTAPPKESMYFSRVPWIFLFGGIFRKFRKLSENHEKCEKRLETSGTRPSSAEKMIPRKILIRIHPTRPPDDVKNRRKSWKIIPPLEMSALIILERFLVAQFRL